MCYPCTKCGRCGKYHEDSVFYVPPASIPCLACGGTVSPESGMCESCGSVAFMPAGRRSGVVAGSVDLEGGSGA